MKYDLKWKNDLAAYIHTFGSFIFEGNVNDLQPVESEDEAEPVKYASLAETVAAMYGDRYCVVFFDHTKCSGKPVDDDSDEGGGGEVDPDDPFNSFRVYEGSKTVFASGGDRIPSPSIELFKEYYKTSYLSRIESEASSGMKGGMTVDMHRILDAMREYNEKSPQFADAKPFMFVLPGVSRYMTVPGRPDDREHAILLLLFEATQLTDSPCKLLMFVDKMNDLPTWFESENSNSAVKKIFLPVPDGGFRETFYRTELGDIMTVAGDEKDKIAKFAAYTENYSLRRLLQLKGFIEGANDDGGLLSPKRLENIDKTVMAFDVGQNRNPWRDPELRAKVRELPKTLSGEVLGQDTAISRVSDALKAAVTGGTSSKKNDRRPRAVFFFAGPTGTGKTEMTKAIAESVFGRADKMIRFDMSEFREEHSDARLFGAPPGYVGYEAGGELTKAIKQDPFSIVLFDEIEKAAPRIWDKFLQILGDGRLTDGKGETVSFTQSIIIFTSNLGITADTGNDEAVKIKCNERAQEIYVEMRKIEGELNTATGEARTALVEALRGKYLQLMPLVGLRSSMAEDYLFKNCYRDMKQLAPVYAFNSFVTDCVRDRIKQYFEGIGRREVLGRIGEDNILVFNFIAPDVAKSIAELTIKKYIKNMREDNDSHPEIELTPAAVEFIKDAVIRPKIIDYGGREVVMCAEGLMSKPVSDYLFDHDGVGMKITLDASGRGLVAK